MSTKGKRVASAMWTPEKQAVAQKARNYIKLGATRGNLLLSGAAQKWKTDPTFTYVPSLRVAGNPGDIERIFVALGTPAADVRQHIAAGYNAASAAGMLKAQYDAELAELKSNPAAKKTKKAAADVNTGTSIASYAAMVDDATVEGGTVRAKSPKRTRSPKKTASPKAKKAKKTSTKKTAKKTKSPAKKSPAKKARKSPAKKGTRGAKALGDKVAALTEGHVMDVSNLLSSGLGAKSIKTPGEKSKKTLIPGTRIVSDRKNGVKNAAKQLGDEGLVERWVAAHSGKPAASPRKSSASPRSSRGSGSPASQMRLPLSPGSPSSIPTLPVVRSSPGMTLPSLPVVRASTIGSPRNSPRL